MNALRGYAQPYAPNPQFLLSFGKKNGVTRPPFPSVATPLNTISVRGADAFWEEGGVESFPEFFVSIVMK